MLFRGKVRCMWGTSRCSSYGGMSTKKLVKKPLVRLVNLRMNTVNVCKGGDMDWEGFVDSWDVGCGFRVENEGGVKGISYVLIEGSGEDDGLKYASIGSKGEWKGVMRDYDKYIMGIKREILRAREELSVLELLRREMKRLGMKESGELSKEYESSNLWMSGVKGDVKKYAKPGKGDVVLDEDMELYDLTGNSGLSMSELEDIAASIPWEDNEDNEEMEIRAIQVYVGQSAAYEGNECVFIITSRCGREGYYSGGHFEIFRVVDDVRRCESQIRDHVLEMEGELCEYKKRFEGMRWIKRDMKRSGVW